MYVSDEKKLLERNALDAFLQSNCKLKGYTIDDGERPDFVLAKNGQEIGIEHFRADTILNEHMDSESMKYDGQRKKVYEKHHEKLVNDELDVDASAKDIETSINKSLDAASKFDYKAFIDNLKDVFEQHAGKMSEYKKKCDEVWFLIEIGIVNDYFTVKMDNGGAIKMNVLPVTGDMFNIFDKHKEISRVIVCSRCLGRYKIVYDSGSGKYNYKIRSFTYTEALIPVSRQIKLDVKDTGKEVES